MKFLPLLEKHLKDDYTLDILGSELDVIYDFDRSHEGIPDQYWASSKKDGFTFRFDENQVLDLIFLYLAPIEGFSPLNLDDCDVPCFGSTEEAEEYGRQQRLQITKGYVAEFIGVKCDATWVLLEWDRH